MLAGIDEGVRATLALLDGTRDRDQLVLDAADVGCPAARTADLLRLLERGGLLEDASQDRSVLATLAAIARDAGVMTVLDVVVGAEDVAAMLRPAVKVLR